MPSKSRRCLHRHRFWSREHPPDHFLESLTNEFFINLNKSYNSFHNFSKFWKITIQSCIMHLVVRTSRAQCLMHVPVSFEVSVHSLMWSRPDTLGVPGWDWCCYRYLSATHNVMYWKQQIWTSISHCGHLFITTQFKI